MLVQIILAALAVIAAVLRSGFLTRKSVQEIHVLVNSRLQAALDEIVRLRTVILTHEGIDNDEAHH
jgi:hypothetical protein